MKKGIVIPLLLLPLFLHAEIIVTKHNGNIENVSDIDTTGNVIYFIHDYQTKSIDRNAVVAIIYEDGQYKSVSQSIEENYQTSSDDVLMTQKSESAWVDLQVGALHTFPDGSKGIIFYVNEDGHGIAVSLQETKAQWDISRKRDIIDIPEIPNLSNAHADASALGEGAYYTSSILRHLPSYQCPAAAWCVSLGESWYLPSAPELLYLFQIANGKLEQKGPISQALMQNGGVVLDGGWYWTSSESERTEVFNITDGGSCATENKDEKNAVRAFRAF